MYINHSFVHKETISGVELPQDIANIHLYKETTFGKFGFPSLYIMLLQLVTKNSISQLLGRSSWLLIGNSANSKTFS